MSLLKFMLSIETHIWKPLTNEDVVYVLCIGAIVKIMLNKNTVKIQIGRQIVMFLPCIVLATAIDHVKM